MRRNRILGRNRIVGEEQNTREEQNSREEQNTREEQISVEEQNTREERNLGRNSTCQYLLTVFKKIFQRKIEFLNAIFNLIFSFKLIM